MLSCMDAHVLVAVECACRASIHDFANLMFSASAPELQSCKKSCTHQTQDSLYLISKNPADVNTGRLRMHGSSPAGVSQHHSLEDACGTAHLACCSAALAEHSGIHLASLRESAPLLQHPATNSYICQCTYTLHTFVAQHPQAIKMKVLESHFQERECPQCTTNEPADTYCGPSVLRGEHC